MTISNGGPAGSPKMMKLRFAGRCRACDTALDAGALAVYDSIAKNVSCVICFEKGASRVERTPGQTDQVATVSGTAGASAQREHDRRSGMREARIRAQHPVIGGFLLAVSEEPQSTRAWATGAKGEERVGRVLDGLVAPSVQVLHDRRIPPTKSNIDHIVVCPTGVFVIDAKKYTGRPSLRVEGGLFRPRTETLMVGSRQQTGLVVGVQKQVALVEAVLEEAGYADVPVGGMLCFVEADWPLIGGDFTVDGIRVLWPKRAANHIAQPGDIDADRIASIHQRLGAAFPSA